jgi:hypothetical protein
MGLRNFFRQTLEAGPDGSDLKALEQRAGEMTPWWDQRGVRDANTPEQPHGVVGYSDLKSIDPTWEPR